METNRKKEEKKKKKVFSETLGGCVIPVRNNSLNDSKKHFLEPT